MTLARGWLAGVCGCWCVAAQAADYAILMPREAAADPAWRGVAAVLEKKRPDTLALKTRAANGSLEIELEAREGYDGHGFDLLFPRPVARPQLKPAEGVEHLLTDDFLSVRRTDLKPGERRTLRVTAGK